ncbi:MAG: ankyrin repeat domain-containing protein [Planctomycetota bacterium]
MLSQCRIRSQRVARSAAANAFLYAWISFVWSTGIVDAGDTSLVDALRENNQQQANGIPLDTVDVNAAQPDGMTALHWAVFHNREDWTRRLLRAGAKADIGNRYGITPLYLACQNGNGDLVRLLVKHGADPNAERDGGESVLMTAARTGKASAVAALIESGAKIDARERKGQTALMWAAAEGNFDAVEVLLDAGADYETPTRSGFTPLLFAVRQGKTQVALRLLQMGVDVDEPITPQRAGGKGLKRGTTPLMLAVLNGHFETAAALLDVGADPNQSTLGYTPLHAITWVRKPLRGDGDPPPQGSGAMTSMQFVSKLVDHGADVNALHGRHSAGALRLNRTDATPLLLAAETGDLLLIEFLVDRGANPSTKNADGCTPLLAACGVGVIGNGDETAGTEEEAIETVAYLLTHGANINATDKYGHSAMHGAAYKSWTKLIPFLTKHDADAAVWNQKNKRGWTPLKIAQGHRPGNFRPSAETIEAVTRAMVDAGLTTEGRE